MDMLTYSEDRADTNNTTHLPHLPSFRRTDADVSLDEIEGAYLRLNERRKRLRDWGGLKSRGSSYGLERDEDEDYDTGYNSLKTARSGKSMLTST